MQPEEPDELATVALYQAISFCVLSFIKFGDFWAPQMEGQAPLCPLCVGSPL